MRTWYYFVLVCIQMVVPYVYYRKRFWYTWYYSPSLAVLELFITWIINVFQRDPLFPYCYQMAWFCLIVAPEAYDEVTQRWSKPKKNKILPL